MMSEDFVFGRLTGRSATVSSVAWGQSELSTGCFWAVVVIIVFLVVEA